MKTVEASRKSSESIDDYLKAILALGGSAERRVQSKELAARLSVAPASITNMLQRLAAERQPLVAYQRHKGVTLSAAGKKRALEIVRHHRLIETFLHKILDYPVNKVHDEAERLEHLFRKSLKNGSRPSSEIRRSTRTAAVSPAWTAPCRPHMARTASAVTEGLKAVGKEVRRLLAWLPREPRVPAERLLRPQGRPRDESADKP